MNLNYGVGALLTAQTPWLQNEAQYVSRFEAKINLELGKKVVEKIMVLPQVSKAIVLCGNYQTTFWNRTQCYSLLTFGCPI
jgi:hypothetical protein